MRSAKLIGSIVLLTFVWMSAPLAESQEFPGNEVQFNGHTYVQREQIFGLTDTDAKGRTNLERMEKGLAPLGTDGEPVVLHHQGQKNEGARIEVRASEHRQINHPLRESEIDREEFAKERTAYWKARAKAYRQLSAPEEHEGERKKAVSDTPKQRAEGPHQNWLSKWIVKTFGVSKKRGDIKQQNAIPSPGTYSEETRKSSKTGTDYSGHTPTGSITSKSPKTSSNESAISALDEGNACIYKCNSLTDDAKLHECYERCREETRRSSKTSTDYHPGYNLTHSNFRESPRRSSHYDSDAGRESHHKRHTNNDDKEKTVHVRGYTRKDGTKVKPHWRSAPGKRKHPEK